MNTRQPPSLAEVLRRRAVRTDREAAWDASWQHYLEEGKDFADAPAPEREQMLAILAARPAAPAPPVPAELTRWQRWRGLFDTGWDARNRTPTGQRIAGMSVSLLINLFFVLFMLASLYLRFGAVPEPEPETVRIQITGFGTLDEAGGGQEAADGDLAAAGAARTNANTSAPAAAAQAARRQTQAPEVETAPALAAPAVAALQLPDIPQTQPQTRPLPTPQPLQVSTPPVPQPSDFQLPPPRPELAMPDVRPELRSQSLPQENTLPAPLPEVRAINLPTPTVRTVQSPAAMPAEREIPEPLIAPQINLPELGMRRAAPQIAVREVGQRALPDLPAAEAQGSQSASSASNQSSGAQAASSSADTARATAQASGNTDSAAGEARAVNPGLPGARGSSAQPGQSAAQTGVGPQRAAASSGWPDPVRGDDWGAAAQNRAGQASGGDRGAGRGQGGSGLFDADGRPRLADDSFKPRFPDPNKEGTWLRRPGLDTRGTMFDGIWRPPETLLQEWVRRGVKSIRIPIPGTNMELECVVSLLQAAGGCLPVGGKDGVFDQPARARQAPDVPFKRELFEDPDALQPADFRDESKDQ